MAVRNKYFVPNEIYFLTFTILGWRNVFVNDKYCSLVYKWFDYVKNQYGNKIYGYVIMPNHLHCLMKITDKSRKPPILIANAKRFLAYQIIEFLKEENNLELLNFWLRQSLSQRTLPKFGITSESPNRETLTRPIIFIKILALSIGI